MIYCKTDDEVELIKKSAEVLGKTHAEVVQKIKPGVKTLELDKIAYEFITKNGGKPSFKGFKGYPSSLCISVNEVVVHGFPSDYILQEGDIISVDCGVYLNGFHSDSAYTYAVGEISEEKKKLLDTTKASLYEGIKQAVVGNRTGDIGHAVQSFVEKEKYSVVRELVGHGVGKNLHEEPEVPNYGKRGSGVLLQNGMVLAIEPMVNLGKKNIFLEKDGWTIRTADRKPSAHFEHTVVVRKGQAEVLTTFKHIEEVLGI
jgi:methionyl aminopeptidase